MICLTFLQGQNQLMFTYGSTSSGKTYTIQGTKEHPGIIPRSLDVIFNTLSSRIIQDNNDEEENTDTKSNNFLLLPGGNALRYVNTSLRFSYPPYHFVCTVQHLKAQKIELTV